MIPKEKAKELYDKCHKFCCATEHNSWKLNTKHCALIAVGEIIDCLSKYTGMHDQEFFDADLFYYKEAKEEIEKL